MNIGENKATVFEPKKDENRKNTVRATISTHEGEDTNGESRYSSWYARFVGDAYKKALKLKNKDRIDITSAKIENNYNKDTEKLYVTVTVFDFDIDE